MNGVVPFAGVHTRISHNRFKLRSEMILNVKCCVMRREIGAGEVVEAFTRVQSSERNWGNAFWTSYNVAVAESASREVFDGMSIRQLRIRISLLGSKPVPTTMLHETHKLQF